MLPIILGHVSHTLEISVKSLLSLRNPKIFEAISPVVGGRLAKGLSGAPRFLICFKISPARSKPAINGIFKNKVKNSNKFFLSPVFIAPRFFVIPINFSALDATVFDGPKQPTHGSPLLVHFNVHPVLVIGPKHIIPLSNKHPSVFREHSLQNAKSFIGCGFCPNRKTTELIIASGLGGHPAI